jgi:hypothetical protein
VSTTVTVTETAGAELQTMNSTVGSTILNTELMNLPNVGRDATTFATLQPATGINGNTAGAVSDQNTFQLDGGSITDDMSGDNNTYIPSFTSNTAGVGMYHSPGYNQSPSGVIPTPVTSIEEFKVGVSNQTADFNQGAGSQVQMVTKRGTNTFHGTAYEYYLDNNFGGANTWDDNAAGFTQPTSHYSRFGAAAGGAIPKINFLGGKWYLFGNYEGYRFPNAVSFTRNYPTASLRAGLIKLNGEVVNLNPVATTDPNPLPGENASIPANTAICAQASGCGTLAQNATDPCPSGACDPRGLGMNPLIQTFWNQYLPLPNNYNSGDQAGITTDNYAGYTGNLAEPQTSNFGVLRVDHDFNSKWHFNATYHYYRLNRVTDNQVDVGGFFPGDTFGDYASTANRPQIPWYYTAGLTTNVTSNLTNDFHYSMTRNYWAYESDGGVPNVAGYPAAFEIGGETSDSFEPYNTDNQDTRTRFWDGHDQTFRDDLTFIKGNHLLQFGGLYEHSWLEHQRIDNGGAINIYEQYLIGAGDTPDLKSSNIGGMAGYTPTQIEGTPNDGEYANLYSMILGMVDQSQVLYTRTNGTTLTLNPFQSCAIPGVAATADCQKSPPALNQSIVPTYNLYFGDSWHIRPTLTVNYGLGYTIEMPPYSPNDAQDLAVDSAGNRLIASQYFGALEGDALQGIAYAPEIGFETINNLNGGSQKYPYNPYYKGFSPRVSVAWNFSPNTVIRGGYARIFGRLNGVDQVLVPILAPGLMQTDQCLGPQNATGGSGCGGPAADVFRVGVDGTTAPLPPPPAALPQPWYPGYNSVATGSAEALDPTFKPNRSDEFNVDIQRQLTPKIQVEVGYIGRIISNEYQSYDLNAVPYMMTEGGQSFANAWGNLMLETNEGANLSAAQPQPFLEAALGGASSAYCTGFSSCTAAWLNNPTNGVGGDLSYAGVHDAWAATSSVGDWIFGRSLPSDPTPKPAPPTTYYGANGQMTNIYENASNGYGNYNAGFIGVSFYDWHGLTMKSNLTYSKAMGTGAVVQATSEYTVTNAFDLGDMYGLQSYDETWNYNMYFNWALPFYRNQAGLAGRFLGGWSVSPLFVAGSGFPDEVNTTTDCESYGESPCVSDESTFENAIALGPLNYSNSRKEGIYGVDGIGVSATGQNALNNPAATFAMFRNPILGVDGDIGGAGNLRGLPFWNCDVALNKKFAFTEKFSGTFQWQVTNVFNHMQPADPFFALGDPAAFGVLGGGGPVQANVPREMEFGFHVDW